MEEVWKDVVGYEGIYEVSSLGNVRGLKNGKILKPGTTGRYQFVVLCKEGKKKDILLHRIVAKAFCDNPYGKEEVNHINEIRTDNRSENLEWCTRLENIRHGTGIQRHTESQRKNSKGKPVLQIKDGETVVAKYRSLHDMQRKTGFHRSAVKKCIAGNVKSSYGFQWRFAE